MQIRPLEDLTKEDLIALILLERGQAEHIGAGGVPLMGDEKDAEIDTLRKLIRKIKSWDIDRAVGSGLITPSMPIEIRREMQAALTQQEQENGSNPA